MNVVIVHQIMRRECVMIDNVYVSNMTCVCVCVEGEGECTVVMRVCACEL